MIKLLAKSQSDGRYYFSEDDYSVYFIQSPLSKSEKEYVDPLNVFLRKSLDTNLTFDDREFNSMEELRAFAIEDCDPEKRGVFLKKQESSEDLLIFAPVEIVKEYFVMIKDMINREEFTGLDLFFKQLSNNKELLKNKSLADEKEKLWNNFDKARFSKIEDMDIANKITESIRNRESTLCLTESAIAA